MSNGKKIVGIAFLAAGVAAIAWAGRKGASSGWLQLNPPIVPDAPAVETGSPNGASASGWLGSADEESALMSWTTPKAGLIYEPIFVAASLAYGLPAGLLSRIAYQESRYNPKAKSPAGALGLMQFMPATAKDFGFDPLDATASIWAAAKYMQQLYTKFGSWKEALAAYNWGQGNVARKGLDKAPTETRNYFSQILADIGLID